MANPTHKSPMLDKFISETFGISRKVSIENNVCTLCNEDALHFIDDLSKKEFTISGMCQNCQNSFFGGPDDPWETF